MIRILALPDPDSFLNLVNQSKGDVFLHLPGEGRNSLKKSRIAQQIIRLMGKKNVENPPSGKDMNASYILRPSAQRRQARP